MNRVVIILLSVFAPLAGIKAQEKNPAMSKAFYEVWNDSLQTAIDQRIEQYRKADATVILSNIKKGSIVTVEQISHDFLFGSNIFLFGQLDTPEKNHRYEETFGTLFNAATIAFFWKTLEPEKGKIRFAADSPVVYRRPATDPVVEFCERKGLRAKGHAIIYGKREWGHPVWMPSDRKVMEKEFERHVRDLAERYGGRVGNWDVVNECLDQANRGMMPDDYTFKTYRWAMKYFPESVTFNTNECDLRWGPTRRYVEIVRDLVDRGVRVDNVGVQMHIFKPQMSQEIADGTYEGNLLPARQWETLETLTETGRPIYISEVTISAPDNSPRGLQVQKELARNFYRLWFSHPAVTGITWWNLVDGGAAPGEPSYSGLYDVDMNRKPAYEALDQLINNEWKTSFTVKAPKDGRISWRGFKGTYRISWTDAKGKAHSEEYILR